MLFIEDCRGRVAGPTHADRYWTVARERRGESLSVGAGAGHREHWTRVLENRRQRSHVRVVRGAARVFVPATTVGPTLEDQLPDRFGRGVGPGSGARDGKRDDSAQGVGQAVQPLATHGLEMLLGVPIRMGSERNG